MVHLGRGYQHGSVEDIQAELSPYALDLAPPKLPAAEKIPYLSAGGGGRGGAGGERVERSRGNSLLSGEFVVEDVGVEGEWFRRMVFLSNPNLTQSEAKLRTRKTKKGAEVRSIDKEHLACDHHCFMIGALEMFKKRDAIKILLVGLGGGALATFMSEKFVKVRNIINDKSDFNYYFIYLVFQAKIDVAELDSAIADVAKEQFDFKESERLAIRIGDGLKFIQDFDGVI